MSVVEVFLLGEEGAQVLFLAKLQEGYVGSFEDEGDKISMLFRLSDITESP